MTAPVVPQTGTTPRILSGNEWEQAQYAPHRGLDDPTKPQGPGRILTGDEWEQASRAGSVSDLKFPALPKIQSAPRESTGTKLDPRTKGKDLAPFDIKDPSTYGNPLLRQLLNPALEHPLATVGMLGAPFAVPPLAGLAIGAGMAGTMVHSIASYGWQKAAEMQLSPEDRARAEADPERISGESAAVQAAMLGLAPLIHTAVKRARAGGATPPPPPGAPVVEETAALAAERVTKAATPAKFFESEQGAETLGRVAAQRGLPTDASPYPPGSPLDASWKQGHTATTEFRQPTQAEAIKAIQDRPPGTVEPIPPLTAEEQFAAAHPRQVTPPNEPPPLESVAAKAEVPEAQRVQLPPNVGPKNLYRRLSTPALEAEYRALMDKQAVEQESARPPAWTEEREARAVEQIENRRRPDGSLSPSDKRKLDMLQLQQGESYNVGRHTFESAAAEQRVNARTKYLAAAEKELTGRGIDPTDALQRTAPAGGPTTVAGTGEPKTRGLSVGVEQKAVENKLTDYLGDLPEYRAISMEDQAARAGKLLTEDAALARRVALGEAPPPADLLPESVFIAVENKAIAEGDVGTLRELASGKLTEQATTMGQRIRTLAERDPESPVSAMQQVVEARTKRITNPDAATTSAVETLRTHIADATKIDSATWAKFIDSLRC